MKDLIRKLMLFSPLFFFIHFLFPIHTVTAATSSITFAFTGDILLDKSVGENIRKYGVDYPFTSVGTILKGVNITAGNLETAVTRRGVSQPKQFTFRSSPESLQGLKNNGFDMVTIANNHTMDYGVQGLFDTIAYLNQYKIGYSGGGKNEAEAFRAYYTNVNGKRIAILGLSRVLPSHDWFATKSKPGLANAYGANPMMGYVKQAVNNSDFTIIMIHWNKEAADYPESYARTLAHAFIDAGADAVIGSHSHTLMGAEFYKNAPIFYSLGNFVFTTSKNPKGSETMIVKIRLEQSGQKVIEVIPAKIVNGRPTLMNSTYNQYIFQKLNKLSSNARVNANGFVLPK